MEEKSILGLIEEKFQGMSKKHKKIATFVLNHLDRAVFMTASQLGTELSISESTVVRFAFALGLSGYPELQKAMELCLRERLSKQDRFADSVYGKSQLELLNSVMLSDTRRIGHTIESLDGAEFEMAVESIAKAENIYICGLRCGESLARFLHYYLCLIRKNVHLLATSSVSELFEQMLYLSEKDCVIGISFPVHSMLVVKAVQYAKDRGAKTVVITNDESSPVVPFADLKLYAVSEMISVVDSLVAPLSVINALIVALVLKNPGEARENAERLERSWKDYQILWNQDEESKDI